MSIHAVSRVSVARKDRWLRRLMAGGALAALLAGGAAMPALAQESTQQMLQRMERLERDLNTLQRQVYRGEAPPAVEVGPGTGGAASQALPADVAGRLQVRMGELERLVQDLTGRVEETQFQTRRLAQRLDQLVSDVDFRLGRIEQATGLSGAAMAGPAGEAAQPLGPGGASAPANELETGGMAPMGQPPMAGQMPEQAQGNGVLGYMRSDGTAMRPNNGAGNGAMGAVNGNDQPRGGLLRPDVAPQDAANGAQGGPAMTGVLPDGTPEEQYRHAFSLLRTSDFAGAEQALKAFLAAHPEHELAGNAQYWLGETYYVRGDMQQAAVAFLDGYRTYPQSSKGPDNLLKLGMTVGQLGQTDQACAALSKLNAEYPQASDAIKRRAVAERQKLGCG